MAKSGEEMCGQGQGPIDSPGELRGERLPGKDRCTPGDQGQECVKSYRNKEFSGTRKSRMPGVFLVHREAGDPAKESRIPPPRMYGGYWTGWGTWYLVLKPLQAAVRACVLENKQGGCV